MGTTFHDILQAGVEQEASDWHIREDRTVSIRVSGTLGEIDFVTSREFIQKALEDIIPENQYEHFERIGDADFAFEEEGVGRFRANLHRERGYMSLTLRFVKEEVPPAETLGLPSIVKKLAESPRGIIFVTGITGAGKSTTLASMIEHMNKEQARHIITVEDPIEYAFKDRNSVIEQREVGLDTISFESALMHVLRQDPDVIVIGEMRDRTTFETALMAAETGHLVMTTLHTMNAGQSIIRILDMYNQHEREAVRKSLANNLRAIICQRLVRRANGRGLVPAVEILINVPIVSKLISENRIDKLPTAIDAGIEDGMISFNRSLLGLINEGLITEEDGLAASNNAEALRMNLSGIFLNTDKGSIISG
jgi:twitching motility protein PilT